MKKVIGIGNVIKNITIQNELLKLRTYKGMVVSVKNLEYEMDSVQPLVPIDTKAMRDSWFVRGWKTANSMKVVGGYNVFYAPFVHEKTDKSINWTRPGSGPKWLQIHFAANVEKMKDTIKKYATIGGPISPQDLQMETGTIEAEQIVKYRDKKYTYKF